MSRSDLGRHKLFIGHLSPDTRTKDLERFFKDHGFCKTINEVIVKNGYGFVVFDDKRDADDAIYELNGKDLDGARIQVEYAKPSGRDDFGDQGRDRDRDYERHRSYSGSYGLSGWGGGGVRGSGDRGSGYSRSRDIDRGAREDDEGYRGFRFRERFGSPYNTEFKLLIDNVSSRCSWQDIKDFFRQAGEVTFAKCHREGMGQGVVEFATYKDMKNALRKLNGAVLFGKKISLTSLYQPGGPSVGGDEGRSRSRSPARRHSRSRSPSGAGSGISGSPRASRSHSPTGSP